MNRRHVQHYFSAYIDGTLSPTAVRGVESHLGSCSVCAAELAEWRAVLRLVSQHAPMSCPVDCAETVIQTIAARRAARMIDDGEIEGRDGERTTGVHRFALTQPSLRTAAAASVLAALVLGGGIWMRVESRLHPASTARRWALVPAPMSHSPAAGVPLAADLQHDSGAVPASASLPVRAHAPDRLQEAFGRSDSLILAADFVEDDR